MQTTCGSLPGRAIHSLILCGAVHVAVFGGVASAQETPAESTVPLQEVIVTGSLIKRTDTETPSPVQIITSEDLKNSGYTNVSDVLRNLAANNQGTLNQAFAGAFAAGATGIALRGLTVGDTLTLVDSKRMIYYPLSDDGERSFVDVTAIPFNAVDSVEVLKDGASALYGADAIAGVVNIKLRPTYAGAEILAEGAATQHNDGRTWHAAGIVGRGDLAYDGYNIYLALDWHRHELILGSNRNGRFTTIDWSYLPEGLNTQPGAVGAGGLIYPNSETGYLINSNTASGQPYAFLPGCTQGEQNAQRCTFAFPGQLQPPTEQTNFIAKFTKALGEHWKLTLTGSIFASRAEQVFGLINNTGQEAGAFVNVNVSQNGGSFVSYPVLHLPGNSPQNPFGKPANLVYSFPDIGPLLSDVRTDTYRFFADVKGTAAGWDLDGSVGFMYAKMNRWLNGFIEPGVAQQDLNNLTYVPGVSTNGRQLFAPEMSTQPTSTLDVVDFHGVHDLWQLPGGPLTLAAGAQYFHNAQNVQVPPTVASGVQNGFSVWSIGSQNDAAAFLEAGGKIFKHLEGNAAIRYDHYDTYGGQATPKFGLKYTPIAWFTMRGTWGKGFRAPSIAEAGNAGLAFYSGNTFDQVLCPGGVPNVKGTYNVLCQYPAVGVLASNAQLKAVTSTNATFGVIFEPSRAFNVSADYYRIQLTNDIIPAFAAGGLNAHYIALVRGPPALLPVCTATVTSGTCPQQLVLTPVGYPAYQTIPYVNAGITTTSGFDIDTRGRLDMGNAGSLVADINWTHIIQYEYGYQGTTYDLVGTHGPTSVSGQTGTPRDRAVASLTWQRAGFTSTLTANYTGSFHITDPSAGYNTCLQSLQARFAAPYNSAISGTVTTLPSAWYPYCSVAHFTDFNLYASYAVNEHLEVHGSITNLFNSDAPVDLQTLGGGGSLAYDAAFHQDGAVGRFFRVGATLRF